jgi:hypothetical protein
MNRRDFLVQSILGGIGLTLPFEFNATLIIVDIKLLDSFKETMKFGGTRIIDGQAVVDVTIDTGVLWEHVRLVDSEGREWATDDGAKTWRCGLMEFSLELED